MQRSRGSRRGHGTLPRRTHTPAPWTKGEEPSSAPSVELLHSDISPKSGFPLSRISVTLAPPCMQTHSTHET